MADDAVSLPGSVPDKGDSAALQQGPWRKHFALSSGLSAAIDAVEQFLRKAGFDRAPWLSVGFAGGIWAWFALDNHWQWLALLGACLGVLLAAVLFLREDGRLPFLRLALASMAAMIAAGCLVVWAKSAMVGAPAIERPMAGTFVARVLDREDQPAEGRVRLVLALRLPDGGRAVRVRVNLPVERDAPGIAEGAVLRLRARLMPPAPPMLPGGHDFARSAWFMGLSATGSVQGAVEILQPSHDRPLLAELQADLSQHVRERVDGPGAAIAATLASGDRGAIAPEDDAAMRDSGLAHLLSISGLHVSALAAGVWFLAMRLLSLWPWLALRVRLPLVAAGAAAVAGIGYTLLTGAEVPTVRSCIGTVLVLGALALGREPLSFRLLATAALFVMVLWPEAVIGPSFQMSFAAVIAIVALHTSAPVRAFLAPREEAWWQRGLRNLAMLLLTGVVIELALMPIGLFHFHRSGVYGALANVIAIPLTTFVSMPLVALGLLLDAVGAGAPAWWLAGKSIEAMLAMAHWVADQPGAVTLFPAMGPVAIALFAVGGLWLALWRSRVRLWGLAPLLAGTAMLMTTEPPDLLVSGDGRHVGITGELDSELLVLREGRSSYARDNLTELAGMSGAVRVLSDWPGARCSRDFCALELERGGRTWRLLIARGRDQVEERALAAACDRADIVIADRWLPRSCRPAVLKADRRLLGRTGGLSINLDPWTLRTVAEGQGEHGWWRAAAERSVLSRPAPSVLPPRRDQ
jgi:competence protein ComEC